MMGFLVVGLIVVVMIIVIFKVSKAASEDLVQRMILKEVSLRYGEKLKSDLVYKTAFNAEIDRIFAEEEFCKLFRLLAGTSECLLALILAIIMNVISLVVFGNNQQQIAIGLGVVLLILLMTLIMLSRTLIFRELVKADAAGERAKMMN